MSLDDWLKPGEDDPDLPDLGLNFGPLSAEDIKWVDLEFLDLASGPPANQDKNRNKNPTLGCVAHDLVLSRWISCRAAAMSQV